MLLVANHLSLKFPLARSLFPRLAIPRLLLPFRVLVVPMVSPDPKAHAQLRHPLHLALV